MLHYGHISLHEHDSHIDSLLLNTRSKNNFKFDSLVDRLQVIGFNMISTNMSVVVEEQVNIM